MAEEKNSYLKEENPPVSTGDRAFGEDGAENTENAPKSEYVPKTKHEKALYEVYTNEASATVLKVASAAIVALTAFAFAVHLLALILTDVILFIETLIITGVPFAAITVMRIIVDAPRPYEVLEFYEKRPKGKTGRSFPSRHVFSVFVIGTVLVPYETVLGISLLCLGVFLGSFRVLLGIHFRKDVIAGALIGVISGVIGHLAILFI